MGKTLGTIYLALQKNWPKAQRVKTNGTLPVRRVVETVDWRGRISWRLL